MVDLVTQRSPFIDGKFISGDGPALEVVNPATEEVIATVETVSLGQLEGAIQTARRTFDEGVWANTPAVERAKVVTRMAEYLRSKRDAIVDTVIAEAGAPYHNATAIQVDAPIEHAFRIPEIFLAMPEYEHNAQKLTSLAVSGKVANSINRFEPIGVVTAISAYNFPFYLDVWKALPGIMAGCSVNLRPSPLTPLSAMWLGEAADAAGLPPGVLNVIIDNAVEGGKLLTSHPAVDMVTFTGSTPVGRSIMAQAAETVKKVHLELGGKSAAIYLPDSVDDAWQMGLGVFVSHSGQGCAICTRLVVPQDRKQDVIDKILEFAPMLPIGDPTSPDTMMGPLITAAQREKSEKYTQLAVDAGATLVYGGKRPENLDKGYYFEPTILDVPDNSNPAAQDEIFGPVLTVLGYEDVDDAVRIANDSIFGLGGMVYGKDVNQAISVAEKIRTGTVWINTAAPSADAPFGGYKQSGIGREMGVHGFREYQEIKHLYIGS
ncbi:MAG: Aldehyde Dehydrogenase [Actinomycetia bacterium]|nr:Aldehyde Dehydrogenase [Actinomycetes bacterium]